MLQISRSQTKVMLISAALTLTVVALGTGIAGATPGALDKMFGSGGIVTTGSAPGDNGDRINALVLQSDGKSVVGGYSDMGGAGTGGFQFSLSRFNPDGALDTSFSGDGQVTSGVAPAEGDEYVNALVLQPDGKIIAAGQSNMGGAGTGGYQFSLSRYNPDGSLDPTFGGDGQVTTGIAGDASDRINALALQPDGKIVAGGPSSMGGGSGGLQFSLARYNANGSLDASFSGDGQVTSGPAGEGFDAINALVLQPDGKIVVAGLSDFGAGSGGYQFSLTRYNTDGTLDATFGTAGQATSGIAPGDGTDYIAALAFQPDGKIVAAGGSDLGAGAGGYQFSLSRYNPNGSLDATFSGDGQLMSGAAPGDGDDYPNAVVLQSDGKIVVGGQANMGGAGNGGYQFSLSRYNPDGTLDATFGGDGQVESAAAPADNSDEINAFALRPDGKIIAGGYSVMGVGAGAEQFALARFDAIEADLSIAKSATLKSTARVGANLTYTLTVNNTGPDTATGVTVTDTLPAGATFVSAATSQGTCSAVAMVTCDLGAVAPGTPAVVTLVATPKVSGELINTAAVSAVTTDPNAANNVATVKTTVPRADSDVVGLRSKVKRKALKRFAGRATYATKVDVALVRLTPGVKAAVAGTRAKIRTCLWLKNKRAAFKRVRAGKRGRCAKKLWLRATGTSKWAFKLRSRLPKGRYVLYSRATGPDGRAETKFTASDRNRIAFKVV